MTSLLTAFLSWPMIIRFERLHGHLTSDSNLSGIQKFHNKIIPRISRISIAAGLFLTILLGLSNTPNFFIGIVLILGTVPALVIGIAEDISK